MPGRPSVFNGFCFEYCNADSLNRVTCHEKFQSKFEPVKNEQFLVQVGHWSNQEKPSHAQLASTKFWQIAGLPFVSADTMTGKEAIQHLVEENLKDVFIVFDCVEGSSDALKKPCFEFSKVSLSDFVRGALQTNVALTAYGQSQDLPLLTFSKDWVNETLELFRPSNPFLILEASNFFFQRVISKVSQKWSVHLMIPKKNVFRKCLDISKKPSVCFAANDFSQWSKNSSHIWLCPKGEEVNCVSTSLSDASQFYLDNVIEEYMEERPLKAEKCIVDADITSDVEIANKAILESIVESPVENFDEREFQNELVPDTRRDKVPDTESCLESDSEAEEFVAKFETLNRLEEKSSSWSQKSFLHNSLFVFP